MKPLKRTSTTISALILALLAAFAVQRSVAGQDTTAPEQGLLISKEPYSFPSFEKASATTYVKLYASKEEYEAATSNKRFEFSKLTYWSDGLRVKAYLYKPKLIERKLPVIILNRGGTVRTDIAPELISIFYRLGQEGFVVLAPMLRQSDGGEGRDEIGGSDVNDVMNTVPLIRSLDFADSRNIFLYGESRGAVMTYLTIRKKFPANAAAVFGSITDLDRFLTDNPKALPLPMLKQMWPDYDSKKEQISESRSAIRWPEEIGIPILIMHGGADTIVDPLHSLLMAEKIQRLHKPYQLTVYEGDNHYLTANRSNRDRETTAWFKRYLKE